MEPGILVCCKYICYRKCIFPINPHVRLLAGLLVGLLVCLSVCQSPSPPPVLTQEIKCYKHQSLSTTGGQTLWPIEVLYAKIRRGNFRGFIRKIAQTFNNFGTFTGQFFGAK